MARLRLQGEDEKKKNIYFEVDTADAPIGEGGMGKVMKGVCVDVATKVARPVAIKFLYADLPEHAIERARREASIQLRNDNLVEMLGFVEVDVPNGGGTAKHYHVVSELLHGISLAELLDGKCADKDGNEIAFARKMLKDYQTDPVHFAKTIVMNVLSGLIALHDAGYIHRDIDPSNIMITADGHIKLIDFGIAKQVNRLTTGDRGLTTTGAFMGKAEYAAPELALGDLKHQNQTTDIYAMGILLFQCIVGHVPFEGPSHEVLDRQIHKKLPLQLIKDKGLRGIVECATDKNQNVRYQTAAQMRVALENLDGRKREMKRSAKLAIAAAVTAAVVAAVAVAGFSYRHNRQVEQEAMARVAAADDSLRTRTAELCKAADASFAVGEKHDEGYEQPLLDAFDGYAAAIATASKMTQAKTDVKPLKDKMSAAKAALLNARKELQDKKQIFVDEGMGDIAGEFDKRVKRIDDALKKHGAK